MKLMLPDEFLLHVLETRGWALGFGFWMFCMWMNVLLWMNLLLPDEFIAA